MLRAALVTAVAACGHWASSPMKIPRSGKTWLGASSLVSLASLAWLACACGSATPVSPPEPETSGPTDAAVPVPDAARQPTEAGAPASGGCNIQIAGAYDAGTSQATAFGDLEQSSAGFECSWRQGQASVTASVGFPYPVALGLQAGATANVDVAQPGGAASFSGACTVDVLAFAPATRGGMSARLSCPSLSGDGDLTGSSFFGSVSMDATVDLPPAQEAYGDAGTNADAGDASASCTMDVHGAYDASGSGEGDNLGCLVSVEGTSYYVEPFGPAGAASSERMEITGNSWCTSCLARYYGGPACTYVTILDEGVRGRFVATYDCEGLRAGDGSLVGASGKIDGIHEPPPE
jgi:hypothetical protein